LRTAAVVLGAAACLAMAWCVVRTYMAMGAAQSAQSALLRSEIDLAGRNLPAARRDLATASTGFRHARLHLDSLGPAGTVARHVPLLRTQVRGAEQFTDAGSALTRAGTELVDASAGIIEPPDHKLPVSAALDQLKATDVALHAGIASLDNAIERVVSLNGYRLVGPLGSARDRLLTKLPVIRAKAMSADNGLKAVIAFAGGSGPRRYLVVSQNPDEIRPTGGFIGTFGVIRAESGTISLDSYDSIESWIRPRPDVVVPPEQAPSPFRIDTALGGQNLSNANAVADWPTAGRLAADLWQRGGEQPVDGVLSISPGFLAKVLRVVGPVQVPGYDETVTAANVLDRIDFHVHDTAPTPGVDRKDFVAVLAEAVMHRLLDAPASQWEPLARAMGQAFQARDMMVWSTDPAVQDEVAARRWDGILPATSGDFFADAEFEYAAKNARGIKRTYDHKVALRPDGSAHITTKLTISNTQPARRSNPDSLSYVTLYGPAGATLGEGGDEPTSREPDLNGHPAAGWIRSAPPQGSTTVTVEWDAPDVAHRLPDGTWAYGLYWTKVFDHLGDKLNLEVDLPPGWRWKGPGPPAHTDLDTDLVGVWRLSVPKKG